VHRFWRTTLAYIEQMQRSSGTASGDVQGRFAQLKLPPSSAAAGAAGAGGML
jgi:hypothetical protein